MTVTHLWCRSGCFIVGETPFECKFLPLLDSQAHTTILATASQTTLTQTFINPQDNPLSDVIYTFPIYEGVSVVRFTSTIDNHTLEGIVKEKEEARLIYDNAIKDGKTAARFDHLNVADIFKISIGNVPANVIVGIEITYVGELKHDSEIDGVRFTIPTNIAPRYGQNELLTNPDTSTHPDGGFSVTVDVDLPDNCPIKSLQSPSHQISVEIGTTSKSSLELQSQSLSKASASLAFKSVELDKDFVLQVVSPKLGEPSAILETHPRFPNQRAIMTTLVPKFNLTTERPEIVFVCDRSGSMSGEKIANLQHAVQVFLKSLPLGVKFNICSFGTDFKCLWPESQTYSQESLEEAFKHVETFKNDFGGTHMLGPFEYIMKHRFKDMNLEVFLLTDGEIWDQNDLFNLINKEMVESKGAIRIFTLGIGRDVSHSLIQGVARAGNGFCQTVGDNEKMDKKVVRMLKASLFPHVLDYSLQLKYAGDNDGEEEFELVESFSDSMEINEKYKKTGSEAHAPKQPISLFGSNADDVFESKEADIASKYDHLPELEVPKYLQTPSYITSLSPYNRTTVYVMLSDTASTRIPKSVILKGTCSAGPLELEIPITTIDTKNELVHQLAARKATKELEEGRGWIFNSKDPVSGKLLKDQFPGRFSDMVAREAVRLGVRYQVSGKWCSFVAVNSDDEHTIGIATEGKGNTTNLSQYYDLNVPSQHRFGGGAKPRVAAQWCGFVPSGTFGSLVAAAPASSSNSPFGSIQASVSLPFPNDTRSDAPQLFGEASRPFRTDTRAYIPSPPRFMETHSDAASSSKPAPVKSTLEIIILKQYYSGHWRWDDVLASSLEVTSALADDHVRQAGLDPQSGDVLATICVLEYLRKKLGHEKDTWEMMAEKAVIWLNEQVNGDVGRYEKALEGLF